MNKTRGHLQCRGMQANQKRGNRGTELLSLSHEGSDTLAAHTHVITMDLSSSESLPINKITIRMKGEVAKLANVDQALVQLCSSVHTLSQQPNHFTSTNSSRQVVKMRRQSPLTISKCRVSKRTKCPSSLLVPLQGKHGNKDTSSNSTENR